MIFSPTLRNFRVVCVAAVRATLFNMLAMLRKGPVYVNFTVDIKYDYSRSSEDNYKSPLSPFVGKYRAERSMLDYSYHQRYSEERQLLHDQLIDLFLQTRVKDHRFVNVICESPLENWVVFTAGPMGAGKGHTMNWLDHEGLFPLDAFVNVNPDAIRELLPEYNGYNNIDISRMGYLTQKEVGYISEVLTYNALIRKKNVLVDGSLRDAHWYLEYFRKLRLDFPIIKIAIMHVHAPLHTVLVRARKRAKVTGRLVPEELIVEAVQKIPESVAQLVPQADCYVQIQNEDASLPALEFCSMKEKGSKKHLWTLQRKDKDEYVFVNHTEGFEVMEKGWTKRFEAVWVMQCAMDFDQAVCKENSVKELTTDEDITSRQSSASLSTMPATTVGYR